MRAIEKDRPAAEWFQAARRSYFEGHQGCPHCHQERCVIRSEWGQRCEFYCMACEFSACYDESNQAWYACLGSSSSSSDFDE
jgi:hypothetical protein